MDSTIVSIMSLPDEVLLEIMKALSMPSRAQCRLVCRKWYDLCTTFEPRERICIGRMYSKCLNNVMLTLLESERSCFHFEFYGLDLGDNNNDTRRRFWETCGPKILSLKLCYGELTCHALANILRYCSKLHTLEFYFHSIHDMREGGLSVACLKDCVDLKLQNKSLKTLKIYFGDRPIPLVYIPTIEDDWSFNYLKSLCYLFYLFPNISNFASHQRDWISYSDRFQGNPRHIEGENAAEELIHSIHEYLSRDQMESIAISWMWLSRRDWTSFITVLSSRTTKITEMIISDSEHSTIESFLELVSRQANLQTITYIFSEHAYTNEQFVRASIHFKSLLRNVPTVRRVWLISHRRYPTAEGESAFRTTDQLVRSAAEERSAEIQRASLSDEQFPIIERFTATTIEPNALPNFDVILLLNHFPNLKDVRLSCLDDDVSETICSKHRQLESLVVKNRPKNEKTSNSSPNFINLFTELRYLEIPETLQLEPERFKYLKYLHIVRHLRSRPLLTPGFLYNIAIPDPDLPAISLRSFLTSYKSACPSLEIACMDLDCSTVTPDELNSLERNSTTEKEWIADALLDFVSTFENLRYFYFNCDSRSFYRRQKPILTVDNVQDMFEQCPSLRVVIIFREIFFKHAIEGGVSRMALDTNRMRNSERFSEVYEFLEMFLKEDKDWWFQDSYFRWFQTL